MTKKSVIAVVLLALMLQPVVVGISAGVFEDASTPVASTRSSLSQEAGTRLEPSEHTNHVPFSIDGTPGFGVMGWPGSGTSGDPYLIEGLNITADVDQVCIQIWNTNAYFIIRDCYINQMSALEAVDLENTTHARIEYTTIRSYVWGLDFDNANNTVISHVSSEGEFGAALNMVDSQYVTAEWSEFHSTSTYGLFGLNCNHYTSTHNTYSTEPSASYAVYLPWQNHTTMSFDTMTAAYSIGLYITNDHDLSLTDSSIYGYPYGMLMVLCPDAIIARCYFGGLNADPSAVGAVIDNSHRLDLTHSFFTAPSGICAIIATCNDTVLNGNTFDDAIDVGLILDNSHRALISQNTISNIGDTGLSVSDSLDVVVSSCLFWDIGSWGMELFLSDRPTATSLEFYHMGSHGLHVEQCDNGTLSGSYFEDVGVWAASLLDSHNWVISGNEAYDIYEAFGILGSDNADVTGNSIYDAKATSIYLDTSDDSRVIDNTLDGGSSTAISCYAADRVLVDSNSITDYGNGIIIYGGTTNATVSSNTITDVISWGIEFQDATNPIVDNNVISNCRIGIYLYTGTNALVTDNQMTNCGIFFQSGLAWYFYDHVFSGNTVNGKPVYYVDSLDSVSIGLSTYGQVIVFNSTFITLGNGVFTRVTCPIQIWESEEVTIENLESYQNFYGILASSSDNITIRDTVIVGANGYRGIYLSYCDRLFVENVDVSRCSGSNGYGLMLQNSDFANITDSTFRYNYYGIRWSSSLNTTVSNCDILDSESYGVYSWGSATRYPVIEDCFIRNATRGIYILDGDDAAIRNNVIIHCSIQGIYVFGAPAQYGEIHLNVIEDNQVGIYVLTSDYYSITNNTVRWNMDYGVRLSGSTGTEVFYNVIALNGDNGDDTSSFDWDDGVSMGNWWDDYTPPGPYAVDGNTDDNYPMQYLVYEPIINSPSDIYYPEGSTGNELVWLPFDDSLRNWQVTIDGAVRAADAWNFVDVTVNIDGLTYGTHTAVVTVWDIEENSVSDTVLIHVYDDTPPTLSSQPHGIAFVDGSGQTVTWQASDKHPGTYTVFMDEEEFAAGSWSTGFIEINIDGQTEGLHVFYMVVRDLDGNSAGDTVKMLFIDDNTDPTIDSPDDITYTHGTTGNSIIWSPSDDYPDTYRVTIDGELLASAAWGGSRVVVVVDGLDVGEYVFELTVFDGSGNSQSDSVAVIVEALEPTGPPPIQIDPAVLLAVAAIAGGAVVVIVVVYLIRKRRAG